MSRQAEPTPTRDAAAERWIALAAAAVTLAARLPFAARRMWDHDSVQFALGVERYDLAAHHPHPPGYPLYVGLLKLLAALGVDPLDGMVGLAIAASAVGAGLFALLAARLAGGGARGLRAGAFAGALFAFDPLLWFYGELPLLYAVEGGMSAALAWAILRMGEGARGFLFACGLFALAGGLRQSTMVLLAPLFLYGLWRARRALSWRLVAAGAGLGAALTLAWLVPLVAAAGGVAAYRRIGAENFGALLPQTSVLYGAGWPALAHNLEVLAKWALQGIFPGAAALLALWIVTPRQVLPGLRLALGRAGWLLAWALPPLLFFALFHVTKAGYTLIHLPALLLALALAAAPAMAAGRWRAAGAVAVAAALGAGLFLFGADRRPDQHRLWAVARNELNRGTIDRYERELDLTVARIRQYPPEETVLVTIELSGTGPAGARGFLFPWHRHLQWYLPEYRVVLVVPEQDFALTARGHEPFERVLSQLYVPAGTRRLLFVLSGPIAGRLSFGPGFVAAGGELFHLAAVPFPGRYAVGPFLLVAEARKAA